MPKSGSLILNESIAALSSALTASLSFFTWEKKYRRSSFEKSSITQSDLPLKMFSIETPSIKKNTGQSRYVFIWSYES